MTTPDNRVYIFWDNSNIYHPARYAAGKFRETAVEYSVRIHFENLYGVARAGREVEAAYCVGSVPPELGQVWDKLEVLGIDVETFERGAGSGKEQAVDQALQVQMLRTAVDVVPPCVAVLLTGDGAGYDEGVGFYRDLERMHKLGWGVEVLSWENACNHAMKEWAQRVGVFVPLERFYKQVTFVQGGRRAEQVSLRGRQRAKPA
jgi:hypothetical protein